MASDDAGKVGPARLPTGVPPARAAFGASRHGGRVIEASNLADADEMRTRVKRKRYPYNIAVVGPQGSGKTTLIAQLAKTMTAGVPEEVFPTVTQTGLSSTVIFSRHMAISLIDTPGDPSQRREVLTALTQADGVIFVVSSKPEEWAKSTAAGEWQEYVKLIRANDRDAATFTVVNKIDAAGSNPNTALSRYMRCAMPLRRYFEKIFRGARDLTDKDPRAEKWKNFKSNNAKFAKNRMFCCSGEADLNVNSSWKEGPSHVFNHTLKLGGSLNRFLNGFGETGYALNKEVRQLMLDRVRKQPLRILIDDVYYGDEPKGWVAVGKVTSGRVRVGQAVSISPGNVTTTCENIKFQNSDSGAPNFSAKEAVAGERVEITIGEKDNSANMIFAGSVMGRITDGIDAPETVVDFQAIVKVLPDAKDWTINVKAKNTGSLFKGEETTEQPFDFALGSHAAYFYELIETVNPRTLRVIEEAPEEVSAGQYVRCVCKLSGPGIPLDEYSKYADTGRFIVRSDAGNGRIVAVGHIEDKEHL